MIKVEIYSKGGVLDAFKLDEHPALKMALRNSVDEDVLQSNKYWLGVIIPCCNLSDPVIFVNKELDIVLESIEHLANQYWELDDYKVVIGDFDNYEQAFTTALYNPIYK